MIKTILQNKIFAMAILMSVIACVGMLRFPEKVDVFVGMIMGVWATFVAAMLDMNKDNQ